MQSFMQMINSLIGLITPLNVLLLLASTCGGILIGALPGLSATMGIALLTGLTYTMSQDMALIVLLGIYVGGIYGGVFTPTEAAAVAALLLQRWTVIHWQRKDWDVRLCPLSQSLLS